MDLRTQAAAVLSSVGSSAQPVHTRVDPGHLNEDRTALGDSPEQEEGNYVPGGSSHFVRVKVCVLGSTGSSVTSGLSNFGFQSESFHL